MLTIKTVLDLSVDVEGRYGSENKNPSKKQSIGEAKAFRYITRTCTKHAGRPADYDEDV